MTDKLESKAVDCKISLEAGSFTNNSGKLVDFDVYKITFKDFPISLRVKPADGTAKEIVKYVLGVK